MSIVKLPNGNLVAVRRGRQLPDVPFGYKRSEHDKYVLEPDPVPCRYRTRVQRQHCYGCSHYYMCKAEKEITLDTCITCRDQVAP